MTSQSRSSENGGRGTDLLSVVPEPFIGQSLEGQVVDPLTSRLMGLIDGHKTVGQLAAEAGRTVGEVFRSLKQLAAMRVVYLPPEIASLPAAPPETEPKPPAEAQATPPEPQATAEGQPATEAQPTSDVKVAVQVYEAALKEFAPSTDRSGAVDEREPQLPRKPAPVGAGWEGVCQGELDGKPAMEILKELQMTRFTGSIRFAQKDKAITVYFQQGEPTSTEGSAFEHELGTMLHDKGRISDAVLEGYRQELREGCSSPVAALKRAGIKKRAALGELVTLHASTLFKQASEWNQGSYTATAGDPVPNHLARCRLVSRSEVASWWRKMPLHQEQKEFLVANKTCFIVPTPAADEVVGRMRLNPKEKRYVQNILSEPIEVRRAVTISNIFKSTARKILCHLLMSSAIQLSESHPERSGPLKLEDLDAYEQRLKKASHFDALVVHVVSTDEEIRKRYENRIAILDPALYPGANPDHLETLDKIRRRMDEAWAVLSSSNTRRVYARETYQADQLQTFAFLQIRKARIAIELRQDYKEGAALALSAVELDPGDAEARILSAEALRKLGRTREAKEQFGAVGNVPAGLQDRYRKLQARLGP